jgi:Rrf2 family transcriptional regulator, nitric oxide-sensitive transcriptional repressor
METIMRLTLYTDFALRTLIQVALNDGKRTTINDIARSFGISKQHLMKVVSRLSQMGYVEAVRGRNGGIRLMREPRHINIGQVVRDTEDRLDVIGCLERKGYCPIERVCVLRSALRDATQAFLAVLGTYFGRFDQAAKSVVIATVGSPRLVAAHLTNRSNKSLPRSR